MVAVRLIAMVLGMMLVTGCAKNKHRVGVMERGEHDYMYIQGDGDKEWYSALELVKIAKKYAQEQEIDYPLEDAVTNVWVYTDDRKLLAEVWFTRGSGEPTLGIDIDRYGRIMQHRMGIGIDRMSADGK